MTAETFISQQQKAIERRNWYQMIAMTIRVFYAHVIRVYKQADFLVSQIFKKT